MVTQSSTFEALEVAVGQALGVIREGLIANSGSTTTFVTDELAIMGNDDLNGKWIDFPTSGGQSNIAGEEAQIIDSAVSNNIVTLTFHPAVSSAVAIGATARLWDQEYRPTQVKNALNQAVDDATRHIFTPTTDISLHTGGSLRYDLIGTLDMVNEVAFRTVYDSRQVIQSGIEWNESVDSDFTITQDDEHRLNGRVSTKFVVAASIIDGDFASHAIGSLDISRYDFIEFPIEVNIEVAASDLLLRLSASANGADVDKIIAIPKLLVGAPTWVRVEMSELVSNFTSAEATAIISVALEYNANKKANIIWLGTIEATLNDSHGWKVVEGHLWDIDKQNQDLVFKSEPGYYLMRLRGGDNPLRLSSDTDVSEIPERYMVHYAAGTLLMRYVAGEDAEQARVRQAAADRQMAMAESAKRSFPILKDARFTS